MNSGTRTNELMLLVGERGCGDGEASEAASLHGSMATYSVVRAAGGWIWRRDHVTVSWSR